MKRAIVIAAVVLSTCAARADKLTQVWALSAASSAKATVTGGDSTNDWTTYRIHKFTSPTGTLVVSGGSIAIDYLIVGAGGFGGPNGRGGAGGGQVTTGSTTLAVGSYAVTIGQPGPNWVGNNVQQSGTTSILQNVAAAFGGRDGGDPAGGTQYAQGGAYDTAAGADGTQCAITGTNTYYGGGGGGGSSNTNVIWAGGQGGGGAGGTAIIPGVAGTANTGGGGGGARTTSQPSKPGGSGIVIVRYLK